MILNVYTTKQLQEFISLLDHARNANITSLSVLRHSVFEEVTKQIEERKAVTNIKPPDFGRCPDCGTGLRPVANPDGLKILGCRKCRYSRLVTE